MIKEDGKSQEGHPIIKKFAICNCTDPSLGFMPPTPFGHQVVEEEEDDDLSAFIEDALLANITRKTKLPECRTIWHIAGSPSKYKEKLPSFSKHNYSQLLSAFPLPTSPSSSAQHLPISQNRPINSTGVHSVQDDHTLI